jgi:K+/H+ antiporter YhaU regulatory subunit KhtT
VRGGAIIVGVRDADGQFAPQPAAETILRSGDVVLAMGTERAMERLEALFAPRGTRARP